MRLPWRVQIWRRDRGLAHWRGTRLGSWQPLPGAAEKGTLLALGDVALLDETGKRAGEHGRAGVFGACLPVVEASALVTANLESMLTARTERNGNLGSFLRAPPEAVRAVAGGPPFVATCANNHCMDHGGGGLLESLRHLDREGVHAVGAGASRAQADAPAVVAAKGVRIGFLARCDDFRTQPSQLAVATPAPLEENALVASVAALRKEVDIVVVHLHIGYEFELHPLLHHRDLARSCAAAGADLVLIHHAHVPMGLEARGPSLIAYGLGNACGPVDAYMRQGHPWTDRSFLLEVGFGPKGLTRYRLHPIGIGPEGSMSPLEPGEAARLLGGIDRLSRRVADDRLLARITRARIAREARGQLLALGRAHGTDAFAELAAYLDAPRQRTLLERLQGLVPDAAAILRRAREEGPSGWRAEALATVRGKLDALDPPGRLPPGSVP
jgi:poly-gamma-glutamate synthesis protein (capsule biosynthesis protein)